MNKLLVSAALLIILLPACSQKHDVTPTAKSVTINGKTYATAIIGHQTWTAENYDGPGGVNYSDGKNNPSDDKLYAISEANAISLPDGWRLPSADDYNTLMSTEGAIPYNGQPLATSSVCYALMAKTGWPGEGGNNSSGFNALPAGESVDNMFFLYGSGTAYLTSSSTEIWPTVPAFFMIEVLTYGQPSAGISNIGTVDPNPIPRGSIRFVTDN